MATLPMASLGKGTDDDSFVVQIEELGNSGFSLAVQLLRNRDDAADAVQDALHTVLRKRRRFDPDRGKLRAWFLKIVRNRCLDLLRQRARRHTETNRLAVMSASIEDRPDVAAEKRETLQLLMQQLMSMSQDQREIILLRDYHNLSYAEVAEVLSIPVGTVMSRLHRARIELKERMAQYR